MGGGKVVIIFDFDRTLIEDDSDRWVLTNMGLTQLFNHLRPTLAWTSLMVITTCLSYESILFGFSPLVFLMNLF